MSDVIDRLVGIEPGDRLDILRQARLVARENMQASYLALFEPANEGDVTPRERYAVATFVTGVHREDAVAPFYAEGLATLDAELAEAVAAEVADVGTTGPYGSFPPGPLSIEDAPGLRFTVTRHEALGRRISAALEHAHMLVFHPRDASAVWLQGLLDAGWSTTGIVTQSQLVAFLAFQVRVVHGLRVLAVSERNTS